LATSQFDFAAVASISALGSVLFAMSHVAG
jgi:hypothetical protein